MIERRIKELAIALEALSRVNGYDASVQSSRVSELLTKTLDEAKELHTPIQPPAPRKHPALNDEIPF